MKIEYQKAPGSSSLKSPAARSTSPFAARPFAPVQPVQRSIQGIVQRVPGRDELEYLVDDNFLPAALQDEAPAAVVLKRTGAALTDWADDQIFYAESAAEDAVIHELPASKINEYWNAKYPSPFVMVSGPDWRANCADYAIGQAFEDVGAAKEFLAGSYTNKGNYTSAETLETILTGLAEGGYVAQVGTGNPHFIKVTIGSSTAHLSQKDQESGVYEASFTKEAAAAYIANKSSNGIVYQKP